MELKINLLIPSKIEEDSWLNDPQYQWFKHAWYFASQETRAIPALSKVTPEDMYFTFDALKRGKEDLERSYFDTYYVVKLDSGYLCEINYNKERSAWECRRSDIRSAIKFTAPDESMIKNVRNTFPSAKFQKVCTESVISEI